MDPKQFLLWTTAETEQKQSRDKAATTQKQSSSKAGTEQKQKHTESRHKAEAKDLQETFCIPRARREAILFRMARAPRGRFWGVLTTSWGHLEQFLEPNFDHLGSQLGKHLDAYERRGAMSAL